MSTNTDDLEGHNEYVKLVDKVLHKEKEVNNMSANDKEMDVDDAQVTDLEKIVTSAVNAAYYRGHTHGLIKADELLKDNDAVEKAYNNGLQDAWECVKKIVFIAEYGGYYLEELKSIFDKDHTSFTEISEKYPVQEVVSRIKEYEKKRIDDTIKVGDEVYYTDENHPRIVTAIYMEAGPLGGVMKADQITETGKFIVNNLADLHRTGKHHVGITEILNSLKGE